MSSLARRSSAVPALTSWLVTNAVAVCAKTGGVTPAAIIWSAMVTRTRCRMVTILSCLRKGFLPADCRGPITNGTLRIQHTANERDDLFERPVDVPPCNGEIREFSVVQHHTRAVLMFQFLHDFEERCLLECEKAPDPGDLWRHVDRHRLRQPAVRHHAHLA